MTAEEINNLINSGVGLIVATCGGDHFPEVGSAIGIDLNLQQRRLRLFLDKQQNLSTLRNLQENPHIAVSLSRPMDDTALQVKGVLTSVRAITTEEREISKTHWARYLQQISLIGMPPDVLAQMHDHADTVIEATVNEIFNQTPGAGAGTKIQGANL